MSLPKYACMVILLGIGLGNTLYAAGTPQRPQETAEDLCRQLSRYLAQAADHIELEELNRRTAAQARRDGTPATVTTRVEAWVAVLPQNAGAAAQGATIAETGATDPILPTERNS